MLAYKIRFAIITPSKRNNELEIEMKHLNELLKMVNAKMDFFMIKACAESVGFELSAKSMPGLKSEIEALIVHAELEQESQTLVIA